jgi:hypothetical protein
LWQRVRKVGVGDPGFRASQTRQREPSQGTNQRGGRRVCASGFRRTAVSQSHASTQPCGKLVNRTEIVRLQFRVIIEDLLLGRAGREPLQHVPSGDAQPADRRLAGEFTGLDRDAGTHLSRVSLARDEWLYDADGRESAGETKQHSACRPPPRASKSTLEESSGELFPLQ